MFSIFNGYNTVNFDLLSPSYEYRLAKYGTRGIQIHVPNFERSLVNSDLDRTYNKNFSYEELIYSSLIIAHECRKMEKAEYNYNESNPKFVMSFHCPNEWDIWYNINDLRREHYFKSRNIKFKGLDLLLYLEMRNDRCKYRNQIEELCNSVSDYSYISEDSQSIYLCYLFNYLKRRFNEYKITWDKIKRDTSHLGDFDQIYHDMYKYDIWLKMYHNTLNVMYIEVSFNKIDYLFNIDEFDFCIFRNIGTCDIPKSVEFKTKNPGEQTNRNNENWRLENQGKVDRRYTPPLSEKCSISFPEATNTFNQIILDDINIWYVDRFYTE